MRKGQHVRILSNNAIGTIADCEFFKSNGQKQIRYLVVTQKNRQGCWYPIEKLGSITETIKVTIRAENGQELCADIVHNYEKSCMDIKITGSPQNLKEHKGMHVTVLSCLLAGLGKHDKSSI